jgi:hypothetical protein
LRGNERRQKELRIIITIRRNSKIEKCKEEFRREIMKIKIENEIRN